MSGGRGPAVEEAEPPGGNGVEKAKSNPPDRGTIREIDQNSEGLADTMVLREVVLEVNFCTDILPRRFGAALFDLLRQAFPEVTWSFDVSKIDVDIDEYLDAVERGVISGEGVYTKDLGEYLDSSWKTEEGEALIHSFPSDGGEMRLEVVSPYGGGRFMRLKTGVLRFVPGRVELRFQPEFLRQQRIETLINLMKGLTTVFECF